MFTIAQLLLFAALFLSFGDLAIPSVLFLTSLSSQNIKTIKNLNVNEYFKSIEAKGLTAFNTKQITNKLFIVVWKPQTETVIKTMHRTFDDYYNFTIYVNKTNTTTIGPKTRVKYVRKRNINSNPRIDVFGILSAVSNGIEKIMNYDAFSQISSITAFLNDISSILNSKNAHFTDYSYAFWTNMASRVGLDICSRDKFMELSGHTIVKRRHFQSKNKNFGQLSLSKELNVKSRLKRRRWKSTSNYV